jgi:peptidoglycan/xylan/chitin deacetylase (PgdA/CDA1 family)
MIKVFHMQGQIDDLIARSEQIELTDSGDGAQEDVTETPSGETAVSPEAVTVEKKKVYLTFDDGPGTQTAKILDILKKQNVKATFFVTGKEDDYSKKMYKRIVDEGHTLGMHSYAHIYSELYASKKKFTKDLDKIYNLLYSVTGVYPRFYRFPGGSSATGTDVPIEELIPVLEQKGVEYLDWNVISPDTVNASVSKNKMIAGILEGVAAYDTSIVLFYDVADRPMTVKALPEIIKQLKKQNCELLPVDETTVLIRHNK